MPQREYFPDGTPIDAWFYDTAVPTLEQLGKPYVLTDHGIAADGTVQTDALQALIDRIAAEGGGVLVVPAGEFLTGALYFKQGVHLHLCAGAVLKGSDDISDYPVCRTRIEGESCLYYPALINADGLDGFTITGEGTVDGNGLRAWKAFWQRLQWNPKATNKDEQRPRLVFLSNCQNVTVAGVTLQNSPFWTNHLYRCRFVKYLGCRILAPSEPVPAPSSDALDIDVCSDVLVKNCYMAVNDDSVVLKGGKGPWADTAPENGSNERILVEDCEYGHCHGCLTCGSESIHNRNILVRRIRMNKAITLLWLKLRPDTPQQYEYITIEQVTGKVGNFALVRPWTQFFDNKGRTDIPLSVAENITVRDCDCDCDTYWNVEYAPSQYRLSRFTLEGIRVRAAHPDFDGSGIDDLTVRDVVVSPQNS